MWAILRFHHPWLWFPKRHIIMPRVFIAEFSSFNVNSLLSLSANDQEDEDTNLSFPHHHYEVSIRRDVVEGKSEQNKNVNRTGELVLKITDIRNDWKTCSFRFFRTFAVHLASVGGGYRINLHLWDSLWFDFARVDIMDFLHCKMFVWKIKLNVA